MFFHVNGKHSRFVVPLYIFPSNLNWDNQLTSLRHRKNTFAGSSEVCGVIERLLAVRVTAVRDRM